MRTALTVIAVSAALHGSGARGGPEASIPASTARAARSRPTVRFADCTRPRPSRSSTPRGTVTRVVGPSMTAQERAAQEEHDKAAAEVRARLKPKSKRRERALLVRYPNPRPARPGARRGAGADRRGDPGRPQAAGRTGRGPQADRRRTRVLQEGPGQGARRAAAPDRGQRPAAWRSRTASSASRKTRRSASMRASTKSTPSCAPLWAANTAAAPEVERSGRPRRLAQPSFDLQQRIDLRRVGLALGWPS